MAAAERTDPELMVAVAQGNRAAFEILYQRYHAKLLWFARGFTKDLQQAEDLVQDVFITIIERPHLYDPNRKFSTWVFSILANACRSRLRNEENRLRMAAGEYLRTFNVSGKAEGIYILKTTAGDQVNLQKIILK